jgi:hypothetical protein
MNNWDEETRLIIDGIQVWSCGVASNVTPNIASNTTASTYSCFTANTFTVNLDANSEVEIQKFEATGVSNLKVTITANTPTVLAGTSTRTCKVSGNTYIDFIDANNTLLASINPNGHDLGNVKIDSYVGSPAVMSACNAPSNPAYQTAYMGRTWVMTSSLYPSGIDFPSAVSVRLPFTDSELSDLNAVAESTTTGNPFDGGVSTPANLSNLMLTKITGATENGIANGADCSSTIRAVQSTSNGLTPSSITATSYIDFNIGQFSEFFLHKNINNSPLAVTLTNFSVTCDKEVSLSWTTASEQNSDKFIVEKSRDGLEWIFVSEKAAAGNSNTTINYNDEDQNSWNGITYYRLRQLDFNGTEEIYGAISTSCFDIENNLTIYPNPNSGQFTVEITSKELYNDAEIILTEITGKVISVQKLNITVGMNQLFINNANLQKGIYIATLSGANAQVKPVRVVVGF